MSGEAYYADDLVEIYHGRNDEVLAAIGPVGCDLIVTSPPYNLGTTTGGGFGHWVDGKKRGGLGKWGGSTAGQGALSFASLPAVPSGSDEP